MTTQYVRILWLTVLLLTLIIPSIAQSQARLHADISFGNNREPNSFYIDLTNQYGVPFDEVCYIRDAGIPDEDISDILFIYTHSHYTLSHIIDLRMRRATWLQLYTWCGIPQNVYYRSNEEAYRHVRPYGNAYGYYKQHWKTNDDIVRNNREQFRYRENASNDRRGNEHGRDKGWSKND